MVILRHSVDGRVTPEQYEARIAEHKRMEVHVAALPKGIAQHA
jgi:hypothetical protein